MKSLLSLQTWQVIGIYVAVIIAGAIVAKQASRALAYVIPIASGDSQSNRGAV